MLTVPNNNQQETERQPAALSYLQSLSARPDRGWAVLLRPSRLSAATRTESLSRAIDGIAAQIRQFRGQVFELPGGDCLAVLSAGRVGQLRAGIARLESQLRTDPNFAGEPNGRAGFAAACDLQQHLPAVAGYIAALAQGEAPADPAEFQPLLVHETVRESAVTHNNGPQAGNEGDAHHENDSLHLSAQAAAEAAAAAALGTAGGASALSPANDSGADEDSSALRNLDLDELTLNLLGPALRALSDTDLPRMLRSQPVCLLCDDGSMLPVYDEIYTSIADLEQATKLNLRRGANRWLLRHLTRILDRRVLTALRLGQDPADLPARIAALRDRLHARAISR
jgi:hypothetical protein